MYKTQIVTDVENNLMVMGRGGINWEIGNDIYTLLCIKQKTNKDLLYSTEKYSTQLNTQLKYSTHYYVMTYMGKKPMKKSGYTCN